MSTPLPHIGPSKSKMAKPVVSVVVPVYNEAENVGPLLRELLAVCETLSTPFELIFINDGSSDETGRVLQNYVAEFSGVLKTIELSRNYGQTAAMAAGFAEAQGEIVVSLDGDLQNDPHDIPLMIKMLLENDSDMVVGWRKNRQDKVITRILPSKMANWIIGKVSGVQFHDYGCSLKVYRRQVAQELPLYGELHRFIPLLAAMDGARITEVPVNHRPRYAGTSKYNLSRTFKVILDLMMLVFLKKFFTRPLHLFGRAGMATSLVGFMMLCTLAFQKLVYHVDIGTRPLLMLGILMMVVGIQFVSTGLLAELQIRTYFESQQKVPYKIRHIYQ